MNKRERTHGGSASAIIIAILFLALMATLGVVFYQNFIQKKADTKQTQTNSSTQTKADLKTARVAYHSTIYALDYPENWKFTTARVENSTDDSDSLFESSDGKVKLRFAVSSNGIGGTCDKNSELKVSYYNVRTAINTRLDGQPLALVETIYDHADGGYDYLIGMTEDSGATHAAVGDAYCTVLYTGIASSLKFSDTKPGVVERPLIIANIIFPELKADKGATAPDMQTIKDLMNTDDYKAAIKILESARKE